MKLLHTSDWHLGRMLYGRSLLPDQEYFIHQVFLPLLDHDPPDLVLISGDIYDRQVAPVQAIRLFDQVLSELHRRKIPLAAVSGNHDGAGRFTLGADMLRESGIYFATSPQDVFSPVKISSGGTEYHLYLLPYCEPVQIRDLLQDDSLRGFSDAYRALLDKVRESLEPGAVHLLAAHCFAAGSSLCESESPLYVGGAGEVDPSAFSGFDYVALGHLHSPQPVGANARYSGSPLKYSFDEERQRKSFSLVEFEGTSFSLQEIPICPLHDMRTLSGTMEELLSAGKNSPSDDYLYLEIQGNDPIYMPAEQLRPYFPNLLGIRCGWLSAPSAESSELRSQLLRRRVDDSFLFTQFFEQVCGESPSPEDLDFFRSLLRDIRQMDDPYQ